MSVVFLHGHRAHILVNLDKTGFNSENEKLLKLQNLRVYHYRPRSWLLSNVPVQPPHFVIFS